MNESPSTNDVERIVSSFFEQTQAPTIRFDRFDVFLASAGNRYIVNLTTTNIPEPFLTQINGMRSALKECGAVIATDFRFHVTLCEIQDPTIDINTIREHLESVNLPPFALSLTRLKYQYFRGKTIQEWRLPLLWNKIFYKCMFNVFAKEAV